MSVLRRLNEMGVHQYYIPQILRLFYGAAANSNAHPALEAYKRAHEDYCKELEAYCTKYAMPFASTCMDEMSSGPVWRSSRTTTSSTPSDGR